MTGQDGRQSRLLCWLVVAFALAAACIAYWGWVSPRAAVNAAGAPRVAGRVANHAGQLGLGDIEARGDEAGEMGEHLAPVDFGSGRGAVALAAGAHYNCAALTDGRVNCWGANDNGQLGLDPTEDYGDARDERGGDMPSVAFDPGFVVSTLALGTHHACALSSDGRVVCWGVNGAGQLGVASPHSTMTPVVLDFGYGKAAFAITAGANHTCAILDGGELHCWGYNDAGQLGVGTPMTQGRRWLPAAESPPIFGASLDGAVPIVDVSAGSSFTCALLETEAVKCWGDNTFGQLGAPGETGEDVPPFTLRD